MEEERRNLRLSELTMVADLLNEKIALLEVLREELEKDLRLTRKLQRYVKQLIERETQRSI